MADSLDSIASYLQTPYGGAVLFGLLIVYPMFRIFRRAGVPAWPAAFVFLPLFGLAVTFACLVLWKWRAAPAEQAGDWMDALTLLTDWLPSWAAHLVVALDLVAVMAFAAFSSMRMGKSPLWVLGLLVPFVNVAVIWYLAYSRWPRIDGEEG